MWKAAILLLGAGVAAAEELTGEVFDDCNGTTCEACTSAAWYCKWCAPSPNSTQPGSCSQRWHTDKCFLGQTTCDSATCSAQKTCESCYQQSLCHWCNSTSSTGGTDMGNETGSCHAIGSVDGCAVGTTCGKEETCSEQPNCTSCYNASSFCHWCGDSCHVIGSVYGCAVGVQCMANSQCIRKHPEFIGHHAPPGWLEMATFWFLVINCTLAVVFVMLCRRLKVFFNQAAALDEREENMREPTEENQRPGDPPAPTPAEATRPRRAREMELIILFDPVFHFLNRCSTCCCGILMLMTISLSVFALTFSPTAPEVNFCNGEVDWKSIIMSLANGMQQIDADYEMLMSLYNPNRLDIDVHSFQGEFFFHTMAGSEQSVASVRLSPYLIPSGSVADKIAVLSIGVERWSALELAALYWEGKLVLHGDIDVSFQLRFWDTPLFWPLSLSVKHVPIDVKQPQHQTHCNCKNGTLPPSGKRFTSLPYIHQVLNESLLDDLPALSDAHDKFLARIVEVIDTDTDDQLYEKDFYDLDFEDSTHRSIEDRSQEQFEFIRETVEIVS